MSSSPAAAPEQPPAFPESLELALLAFHRNVGPIRKQSEAKYGAFADLRTVLEAITPHLLDQGLVLTQSMEEGPDGSCLLRTELTHAPSGKRIASRCPIPTLQSLLDRVHQLREAVIQQFPLDLPLAAIGALPPAMPPRNAEPGAALPPPPERKPGLRLDDQLKGLYTLLGQVGTTTNPLHSLGGTITYLRRYQILSLLCLAAEDSDGDDDRPRDRAPAASEPAPRPSAARGRGSRSRVALPEQHQPPEPAATPAPRPAPTPGAAPAALAPASAGPSASPEGEPARAVAPATPAKAAAAPAAPAPAAAPGQVATAAPAQQPDTAPVELAPAEVQQLIAQIRTLPTETIPHLVAAFRTQFKLPSQALVSDYITTTEHAQFVRAQVARLAPAAI